MKRLLPFLLLLFTFSILSAQECDMCGDWMGINTKYTNFNWTFITKYYMRCRKYGDSYTVQIKENLKGYDREEKREVDKGFFYWEIENIKVLNDRNIAFTHLNKRWYGDSEDTYKLIWVNGSIELWGKRDEVEYDENGEKHIISKDIPYKKVTFYKDNDDW